MEEKIALHTAARRYCEEMFLEWTGRYTELQARETSQVRRLLEPGWDYSDEAYRTFPRYRIAKAIQIEIERLIPESSATPDELRRRLIHAVRTAEAQLLAELKNPVAHVALQQEANNYSVYINALAPTDLIEIKPLPFRRVLDTHESKSLWNHLKQLWDIGEGYWFPLKKDPAPSNTLAFHTDYFEKMEGVCLLREILAAHGISKVFQLQEFGSPEPEYEIDLAIFEPAYSNGGEQYSTSEPIDWVVYASHESSITIAGDWLADIFKKKWPEWNRRTYEGPFSTDDLRGTWKQR